MLTIAVFIGVIFICSIYKLFGRNPREKEPSRNTMSEQQEQVRCSSSESDNFEKIDSDEIKEERHDPNFVVGDESSDPNEDDEGPSHEGGDSFPNAPPPNIRRVLTPAQQLALAEKRSKLKYGLVLFLV